MNWFHPLKNMPQQFRKDYIARLTSMVKTRTAIFCLVIVALFLLAYAVPALTNPSLVTVAEYATIGYLALGAVLSIGVSKWTQNLAVAKINTFCFIAFMLAMLILGASYRPESFNYPPYMLSLFFTCLMLPWFFTDLLVIIFLHLGAFIFYNTTRNQELMTHPPTIFGTDPFINGLVFIIFTAIMCCAVRYKENSFHLNNFLLLKEVETRKAQMESDLAFAARIQDTLVPQPFESKFADIFITTKPLDSIGGDYAHFHLVDDKQLAFFIGDVTGHGIPAALIVNRLHTEFSRLANLGMNPGKLLNQLNQFMIQSFGGTNMYLTAFCGLIDFQKHKLLYSNYGHPSQYVFRSDADEMVALESQTSLLGIDLGEEVSQIYENTIDYTPGDALHLFTDGILETKNELAEEYGNDRLQRFIKLNAHLTTKASHEHLIQEVHEFGNGSFNDDVLLISIKTKV